MRSSHRAASKGEGLRKWRPDIPSSTKEAVAKVAKQAAAKVSEPAKAKPAAVVSKAAQQKSSMPAVKVKQECADKAAGAWKGQPCQEGQD